MNGAEILTEFGIPMKNQAQFGGIVPATKSSLKWPLIAFGAGLLIGGILAYRLSTKLQDQLQAGILAKLSELQAEIRLKPNEKQWQSMKEENDRFMKDIKGIFDGSSEKMETLIADLEYFKAKMR